ncbi:hypothetical protein MRB53_005077 [Persea americana]|uniref:Uncharacterized protein n=1 Tax=Persea americana TaxID=3435 RepID=A0ACC2MC91_PERAE|nr:hypothetical protein MRB53_005077 [Persea americana]
MEEEKQRRKEENKEVSSCYQVQQQPAGTVIPECNVCETTGTILMVPGEGHPLPSSFGETRKHATIMVFDCDGVEPNETKREIHDIYISDGEFADFHEHDNKIVPVSIWKADAKFVKSE